jgi:hypothetical protein
MLLSLVIFLNKKKWLFKTIESYSQFFFGGTTIACGDTEYTIASQLGKKVL